MIVINKENKAKTDSKIKSHLLSADTLSNFIQNSNTIFKDGNSIILRVNEIVKLICGSGGYDLNGWAFIDTDDNDYDYWEDVDLTIDKVAKNIRENSMLISVGGYSENDDMLEDNYNEIEFYLNNKLVKFGSQWEVPTKWLYQDFEKEFLEGKAKRDQELKQKFVKSNTKFKPELLGSGKTY